MPIDNRATAERIAQEVYKKAGIAFDALYPWLRKSSVDCALAGMAHRVRTAEREAAKKAWGAAREWMHHRPPMGVLDWNDARDRYIAAEFDAGERVIRCALCQQDGADISTGTHTTRDECIEALGKRLAEQRGAER